MPIRFPQGQDWFREQAGFPRPDWTVIVNWLEKHVPPSDYEEAWSKLVDLWLGRMQASLGDPYAIRESEHFILLSAQDPDVAADTLRFLEGMLADVKRVLGDLVPPEATGKHVSILFRDDARYYEYISHFYPDNGDYAGSGGVFLDDGCDHFVLCTDDPSQIRPILAHELIHDCLAHLPLPSWLGEGMSTLLSRGLCGTVPLGLDPDVAEKHFAFWNEGTIQEFWAGKSFERTDDGCTLSYDLALLLVYRITHDRIPSAEVFRDFVKQASGEDAGAGAARKVLGLRLGEILEEFLGPGEWDPKPNTWAT